MAYENIEKAYHEIEDGIIKTVEKLGDGDYLKIKDEVIMTHVEESLIQKILQLNEHINDNSNLEEFEKRVLDERVVQINDKLIYLLCDYYINKQDIDSLLKFTTANEVYFSVLPQAKTAKLIKNIVEKMSKKIRNISTLYVIFKKYANWAYEKKRNFLKCRIEVKIVILYILKQKYKTALVLVERLLKEVKKLDDKTLLLELYIIETKIYMLLKNTARMKTSLTFAKNVANSINTAIYINGEIDFLSGVLFIFENDYKSAYIYLYECYETLYSYIYNSRNNALDLLSKKHSEFNNVIMHNIINTSTISSQNKAKNTSQISPFLFSFYTFYEYYDIPNSVLILDEPNINSTDPALIYGHAAYNVQYKVSDEDKIYCATNPIEADIDLLNHLAVDTYGNLIELNRTIKNSTAGKMSTDTATGGAMSTTSATTNNITNDNSNNKNSTTAATTTDATIPDDAFICSPSVIPAVNNAIILGHNKHINSKGHTNIGLNLNVETTKLVIPLKYLILCKILDENNRKDINNVIADNNKLCFIQNKEVQILLDISKCYHERSLDVFEKIIQRNFFIINIDKVIHTYLNEIYELLLEKNILKIIEAYSCIDLAYISKKLSLGVNKIITKLSEMILDKKLNGTLDQNAGVLILYEEMPETVNQKNILEIIDNLTESVDILYQKAQLTI